MRSYFCYLIGILLFVVIVRCSSDENVDGDVINEGAVTEIGVPLGPPITADIGPSGGVITSADEVLRVTVPPGAVATNTTFSVQPIEDFCPGGMGSYRLLPEGMTFAAPVTITFHYTEEDLEGTLSDLLDIAYQGTDQIWYALSGVILDEQSRTISVDVTHFTDWALASSLRIQPQSPAIPVVEKGATYKLHLAGIKHSTSKSLPGDLVLLPRKHPATFPATWFVNGVQNGNSNVGTISTDNNNHVTYHAPANVPANNPVLVTAELTDFEVWDRVNGKLVRLDKVICMKRIMIRPDEYNFTLEVDVNFDHGCGVIGIKYHDFVTMDVQVKDIDGQETVTFSEIINEDATTNPFKVTIGDCTVSCSTGGPGVVNVTSAFGDTSFEEDRLIISLFNTEFSTGTHTIECLEGERISTPIPSQEYQWQFPFVLSSENTQIHVHELYNVYLIPK
jgi:hypothetical protein